MKPFFNVRLQRRQSRDSREHGIAQAVVFRLKAAVFQLRRTARDLAGGSPRKFARLETRPGEAVVGVSRSELWSRGNEHERRLQAGKVENLRIAARSLHGIEVPAGEVFSFWKHVGGPWKSRGFVVGRELREGCLIPNIGGGLCQLSNALYDCALQAGAEIVERHAHSQVVPGSLAERGRDATVFWNYIDLRFRPVEDLRIEVVLNAGHLTVRFLGKSRKISPVADLPEETRVAGDLPASCASCGMMSCFRNIEREAVPDECTAVLADEVWPEYDDWLQEQPEGRRELFLPIDGKRFGLDRYAWQTAHAAAVRQFPLFAAWRSYTSRRLASQGAARQRALLRDSERLAKRYAQKLTFEMTHLVVTQSLLPYLWRSGALGGRTFDVLLTRWPILAMQEKLDAAARLHPESPTLADFRADRALGLAEQEALAAATRVITPHAMLAAQFCNKAVRLEWKTSGPMATQKGGGPILFPASTLGRKGAYELREALRGREIEVMLGGPVLERADFWSGVETRRMPAGELATAALVVLPTFVENQPRQLLRALALGIPIITTPESGLAEQPGVTLVPAGNVEALRGAIDRAPSGESEKTWGVERVHAGAGVS